MFLIFLFLPLLTYKYSPVIGDIAEYLNNPARVIVGQLPYRDFWLLMSPGEVFLPALIYKMFGLNINLLLIFSIFINALIGLFSFFLGRAIFKENFFALIVALLIFFNGVPAYVGYTYINAYFLFLLLAALFFINYWRNNNYYHLFLSGLFIGLAFFFRIYEVGAAALAIFLLVLFEGKIKKQTNKAIVKSVSIFSSGILLIIGIISLSLIRIWVPMVKQIVFESLAHGTSMNLPYFYSSGIALGPVINDLKMIITGSFLSLIKFFYHFLNFANITLLYLLPFLLIGLTVWVLRGKILKKSEKIVIFLFLLWGIFTLPKAMGRADIPHVSIAVSPFFFLLIYFLSKVKARAIKYGLAAIAIILLIPCLIFIFKTFSILNQPRHQVKTEHGNIIITDEGEARELNDVIGYINQNTQEGDYIFVTPWLSPPLYAMTNRKNPTYYDSLIDLIALPSKEKQEKVCQDLLNKNTKVIIHNPDFGFDNKEELQFKTACPIIEKCIDDNFKLVKKEKDYWIYLSLGQKND